MPSNPMQRKVRNSFLLGMIITLVIAILIGAMLFFLIVQPILDKQSKEVEKVFVYRLRTSVKSGNDVDSTMLDKVEIPKDPNSGYYLASNKDAKGNATSAIPFPSGYKSKIDLKAGTILTSDMLYKDENIDQSLRYVEYNMITIPTTLQVGDYVDIRLRLSSSLDLIVISQKCVENIYGQTIGLNLTEDEIITMNSAMVDAFIMPSAELYVSVYVAVGEQKAAEYTYRPSDEAVKLIADNNNIVLEARKELVDKYNALVSTRTEINDLIGQIENKDKNIEEGMKTQMEAAKKARLNYLAEVGGY